MKKTLFKILVTVVLLAVCIAAVQLTVGLSSASFSVTGAVPFVSAGMMLIMCWNYGRYPKKSVGMNAGGARLSESERTLMYHTLASTLAYFVIPDLFLIAYFPSVVRLAGGALLFILGVYTATAYARKVTDRAFKERIAREGDSAETVPAASEESEPSRALSGESDAEEE